MCFACAPLEITSFAVCYHSALSLYVINSTKRTKPEASFLSISNSISIVSHSVGRLSLSNSVFYSFFFLKGLFNSNTPLRSCYVPSGKRNKNKIQPWIKTHLLHSIMEIEKETVILWFKVKIPCSLVIYDCVILLLCENDQSFCIARVFNSGQTPL